MLREKAGNPTYRVLAKQAGYSATTLSEAAAGMRRPSLDVTLAYVGACDGDVVAWQQRWRELPAVGPAARVADPAGPAGSVGAPSAPPAESRRSGWRSGKARAAVVAVSLAVVAAGTAAALAGRGGSAAPVGAGGPACPAPDPTAAFTGRTYLFTRVRGGAALSSPVLRTIPAGCDVGFTGFCIGDVIYDSTGHTPDTRWFMLAGGGVLASAIVHGNPPATLAPSTCPDDVPPPQAITFGADPGPPAIGLRLHAAGRYVRIVGYAGLYADEPGDPRWHQLGLVGPGSRTFDATWRPSRDTDSPRSGARITVAAVACLGGDGPTDIVAARTVPVDDPSRSTAAPLAGRARADAERSACGYPAGR
jgi:hypothetical protein